MNIAALKFAILSLFNSQIRGLLKKYGYQIAKQLFLAGLEWVEIKNAHPEWTQMERHAALRRHIEALDLIPETKVDDQALDFLAAYFIR